jgi:uncharacterized OB-fold protein
LWQCLGFAELIMTYTKPLPAKDPESTPFWEGCARHELLIPQCNSCATYRFPPTTFCPNCRSSDTIWRKSRGHGNIFSWIVVRHPVPREVYIDSVPYAVAIVTLTEGVRMVAYLEGYDVDKIQPGMPVTVGFHDVQEGIALPVFRPVETL